MELKHPTSFIILLYFPVLIVLYGIETQDRVKNQLPFSVLIVLYGIETWQMQPFQNSYVVLIVLYGIETRLDNIDGIYNRLLLNIL